MKKFLALFILLTVLTSCFCVFAEESEISVFIDGIQVKYDVEPVIINGYTMVPIRKTAEVLGAEVEWDAKTLTATLTQENRVVTMTQNDPNLYINGIRIGMDSTVTNHNDRILIPVRSLAEALDATVVWDKNERCVEILTNRQTLTIGDKTVVIGDSVSGVTAIFGQPDRIDSGTDRFEWYIYNNDLSEFLMVAVMDGKTIGAFTAFTDFTFDGGIRFGDIVKQEIVSDRFRLYTDDINKSKVYAIWVGHIYSSDKYMTENFEEVHSFAELELADITNAFRYYNELEVLTEDETATKVCRMHSQDMADRDYFSHTNTKGKSPWDRYDDAKGEYYACTESIDGGKYSPIEIFDAWLNSADHRANLLHEKATFAGVGMGYNEDSEHGFYTTQMFSYAK